MNELAQIAMLQEQNRQLLEQNRQLVAMLSTQEDRSPEPALPVRVHQKASSKEVLLAYGAGLKDENIRRCFLSRVQKMK